MAAEPAQPRQGNRDCFTNQAMVDFQLSNPMGHSTEVFFMAIDLAQDLALLGLAPPAVRLTGPSKDQVRYRSVALAHDRADLGSH